MKIVLKILLSLSFMLSIAQADEVLTRATHKQFIDKFILSRLASVEVNAGQFKAATKLACDTQTDADWDIVKRVNKICQSLSLYGR